MFTVQHLAIIGSRAFEDYALMKATILEKFDLSALQTIISGGATGADTLAERLAAELNLPTRIFAANWKCYGRSAGPRRNRQIVEAADFVLAFPQGASLGTKNTIAHCQKLGKPYLIIEPSL